MCEPSSPRPHLGEAGGRVVHGHRVVPGVHEHRHQVAVLRVHVGAPQLPRPHLLPRQTPLAQAGDQTVGRACECADTAQEMWGQPSDRIKAPGGCCWSSSSPVCGPTVTSANQSQSCACEMPDRGRAVGRCPAQQTACCAAKGGVVRLTSACRSCPHSRRHDLGSIRCQLPMRLHRHDTWAHGGSCTSTRCR